LGKERVVFQFVLACFKKNHYIFGRKTGFPEETFYRHIQALKAPNRGTFRVRYKEEGRVNVDYITQLDRITLKNGRKQKNVI